MAQLRVVMSLVNADERESILADLRRYMALITAIFPVDSDSA